MTNTRRMLPVFALGVLIILSAALANILTETDQLPLFIIFLLISLLVFLAISGAGVRRVERSTFVVRRDMLGGIDFFDEGTYLYIPYLHKIEAIIPSYAIRHEFEVGPIDTRSIKLGVIEKIKVRATYHLVASRFCHWFYPSFFDQSQPGQQRRSGRRTIVAGTDEVVTNSYYAFIKDHMSAIEEHERLGPEDPELWPQVLNKAVEASLDDLIRDQVWDWQEMVDTDERLKLANSYTAPTPLVGETDPYVLDLNRRALAAIVRAKMDEQTHPWGLRVQSVVFEEIRISQGIIDARTRNKPREIANAEHDALRDAITIKGRGLAEAEVRAAAIGQIIARLSEVRGRDLSDELIYKIVHAAMYGDGQMIWEATMEKPKNVSVKAA